MRRNQLCLRLIQALVSDGHDLVEDVADVLLPAVAVGPVVSVGRRQGHAPLHRVPGQVDAGQRLQHPGLLVHRPAGGGRQRRSAPGSALSPGSGRALRGGEATRNNDKNQYLCFARLPAAGPRSSRRGTARSPLVPVSSQQRHGWGWASGLPGVFAVLLLQSSSEAFFKIIIIIFPFFLFLLLLFMPFPTCPKIFFCKKARFKKKKSKTKTNTKSKLAFRSFRS